MKKEALIQAEEEEAKLAEGVSLPAMIGQVLTKKNIKLDQLVREWDVMGSGEITLVEFRKSLRDKKLALPKELLDLSTIDELFHQLDEDHGGSLDLKEMRVALKTFQVCASSRPPFRLSSALFLLTRPPLALPFRTRRTR